MAAASPTISVVLATFNGAAFLRQQLDSLARQSRPPCELIVSDDASGDGTHELVERFVASAPFPVLHVRNPRPKGFRENFLAAAALARGDWIAFCDQDDVWHPDKLAVCAPHMALPGATQIAHQATLIDGDDQPLGPFAQGIARTGMKEALAYDVWGTFWGFSMLVDRRLLRLVAPEQRFVDYIDPRHRIAHDRWAFFLAQTLGRTVEIAQPLVAYRQHGNNLYGKSTRRTTRTVAALRAQNAVYIEATQRMLEIVAALPATCEQDFPAFDRMRALAVYGRALTQLRKRGAIYDSGRAAGGLRSLAMLASGGYREAQGGALRWRSFLRDLSLAVAGR